MDVRTNWPVQALGAVGVTAQYPSQKPISSTWELWVVHVFLCCRGKKEQDQQQRDKNTKGWVLKLKSEARMMSGFSWGTITLLVTNVQGQQERQAG